MQYQKIISILSLLVISNSCLVCMSQVSVNPRESRCELKDNKSYLDALLRTAITNDDENCVREILRKGVSPVGNLHRAKGTAPIIIASNGKKPEIMRMLFSAGVNPKSEDSKIALRNAINFGYFELVKMMLSAGVDPNQAKDENGGTALMIAAAKGHEKIVDILLANQADCSAVTITGVSALMVANDNPKVIHSILDSCNDIDLVDNNGQTSLHFAVRGLQIRKLEILLEKGANPTLQDENGNTPLKLAEQLKKSNEKDRLVTLLLRANIR